MYDNPSRRKDVFATIVSVTIGIVVILFFVNFINIPVLPSVSIWIVCAVFYKVSGPYPSLLFFKISITLTALFGVYIYGRSIIISIRNYPQYLTIFGILFEIVTLLSIIVMFLLFLNGAKKIH